MFPTGFGVAIPWQNAEVDPAYYQRAINKLKPPCWYNHKFDGIGPKYTPMLWQASSVEKYASGVSASGIGDKVWFVGNEPEISSQSDDTPEEFASGVEFWDKNINKPFAVPGILWSEKGRAWWIDYKKLDAPESDCYHIHIYAYGAEDWMRQLQDALKVFNDKPLIVSECGGWFLMPMLQSEIMQSVYTAIALKWISAAFWFSAHYGTYESCWSSTDCLDANESITDVGRSYKYWSSKQSYNTYFPVVMG